LLEMSSPILTMDQSKMNILCKTATFPERTIATTQIWRYGRPYNVRSETEYGGSCTLTFLDDDKASMRSFFDEWLKIVDYSGTESLIDIASFEAAASSMVGFIKNTAENPLGVVTGLLNSDLNSAIAIYQSNFNVWALDGTGEKVYGYKYQNCYPTAISEVEFSDESTNKLVEFTVTFTYSEFEPLSNSSIIKSIKDADLGNLSVEGLFD